MPTLTYIKLQTENTTHYVHCTVYPLIDIEDIRYTLIVVQQQSPSLTDVMPHSGEKEGVGKREGGMREKGVREGWGDYTSFDNKCHFCHTIVKNITHTYTYKSANDSERFNAL